MDYRYTYASGGSPAAFKREGKPTEEVLTPPYRPPDAAAVPAGWRFETQIIALVLSADQENDTDVLAITGASAALARDSAKISQASHRPRRRPFVNPTFQQRKESKLDLVVPAAPTGW